ncbi:MAG TPA: hypothetical protein VHM25_18340, partial [Polyangiaceae bacterium]|nr:hypothetical protein [Polyangiaceae bacterium]
MSDTPHTDAALFVAFFGNSTRPAVSADFARELEGVEGVFYHEAAGVMPHTEGAYRKAYFRLWDQING